MYQLFYKNGVSFIPPYKRQLSPSFGKKRSSFQNLGKQTNKWFNEKVHKKELTTIFKHCTNHLRKGERGFKNKIKLSSRILYVQIKSGKYLKKKKIWSWKKKMTTKHAF